MEQAVEFFKWDCDTELPTILYKKDYHYHLVKDKDFI